MVDSSFEMCFDNDCETKIKEHAKDKKLTRVQIRRVEDQITPEVPRT